MSALPSVMVAGIVPADIRVRVVPNATASDRFGHYAIHIGAGIDLYLTADAAVALVVSLREAFVERAHHIVVDSDTGETLTPPLPLGDATAIVAATTGRSVETRAVTR